MMWSCMHVLPLLSAPVACVSCLAISARPLCHSLISAHTQSYILLVINLVLDCPTYRAILLCPKVSVFMHMQEALEKRRQLRSGANQMLVRMLQLQHSRQSHRLQQIKEVSA